MRQPAVAGRFYPDSANSLKAELEACFLHPLGPGKPLWEGNDRNITAAVVPHAGYRASGMNAAHAYKAIKENGLPDAYIVIGPDHYGVPYRTVMCSDPYVTPLGVCEVHQEIAERLGKNIPDDPKAHRKEHSAEVQVPFIQHIDPAPKIVPIIMRDQSEENARDLAKKIKDACSGFSVAVIASSDLSHYIPKKEAERVDNLYLKHVLKKDINGMYQTLMENRMTVCGYGPIATAALFSEGAASELLCYSDSHDALGTDDSAVVGYSSVIFRR